jgi:hypothetical protein
MMNNGIRVMRRPRPPATRTAAAVVAAAAVALLAAACGSSPSSSGGPSSPPAGGGSSAYLSHQLTFARCVRSHGVPNFPDPDSRGVFPKTAIPGVSVSRLRAAEDACQNLAPAGQPPLTAQDQQDYLKAATCMRSHGITNFPDPTFSGGGVHLSIPASIDTSSQLFNQARQTCEKFIPAGLPYSGSQSGG